MMMIGGAVSRSASWRQVEPAHPGQTHINHEARRAVGRRLTQKFLCRSERPDNETYRSEEAVEGRTDGSVIIHHEHDRARPARGLLRSGSTRSRTMVR